MRGAVFRRPGTRIQLTTGRDLGNKDVVSACAMSFCTYFIRGEGAG